MVSCVGISGHDRVRRSGRDIVTACNARGSDREQRLSGNRIWLEHCLGHALFGNVSLRQRDWDRTHGDEQKQVKRTSDKVRFDTVFNLLFHGGSRSGVSNLRHYMCKWHMRLGGDPKKVKPFLKAFFVGCKRPEPYGK